MIKKVTRIGVGLYSIPDAARLVGAKANRVRRWVDPEAGLVPRYLPESEQTLSFLELMELHFIKMFRDEGVSLQTIRKAAIAAESRFDAEYPFAVQRFDTDGKTIFATLVKEATDEDVVEDLRKGQYVFNNIMRPFFRKLDYHGANEALRFWPLEKSGRVVLDPERQFGKPLDSETAIPTRTLHEAVIANGGDVASVAKWFDVPRKAVDSAVKFETMLTAAL